eukprot:6898811-Prymnesium_polylepis.1
MRASARLIHGTHGVSPHRSCGAATARAATRCVGGEARSANRLTVRDKRAPVSETSNVFRVATPLLESKYNQHHQLMNSPDPRPTWSSRRYVEI